MKVMVRKRSAQTRMKSRGNGQEARKRNTRNVTAQTAPMTASRSSVNGHEVFRRGVIARVALMTAGRSNVNAQIVVMTAGQLSVRGHAVQNIAGEPEISVLSFRK